MIVCLDVGEGKITEFCAGMRVSSTCNMYLSGLVWCMECESS